MVKFLGDVLSFEINYEARGPLSKRICFWFLRGSRERSPGLGVREQRGKGRRPRVLKTPILKEMVNYKVTSGPLSWEALPFAPAISLGLSSLVRVRME